MTGPKKRWVRFTVGEFAGRTLKAWPDEAQRYIDTGIAHEVNQDGSPLEEAEPEAPPAPAPPRRFSRHEY